MISPETVGNLQNTVIESLHADPRIVVVGGREKITLETHPYNIYLAKSESHDKLHQELDIYAYPEQFIDPHKTDELNALIDSLVPQIPDRVPDEDNWMTDNQYRRERRAFEDMSIINIMHFGFLSIWEQDPDITSAFAIEWQSERETCVEQTTRVRLFPSKDLLAHTVLGPHANNPSALYLTQKVLNDGSIEEADFAKVEQALDTPALRG